MFLFLVIYNVTSSLWKIAQLIVHDGRRFWNYQRVWNISPRMIWYFGVWKWWKNVSLLHFNRENDEFQWIFNVWDVASESFTLTNLWKTMDLSELHTLHILTFKGNDLGTLGEENPVTGKAMDSGRWSTVMVGFCPTFLWYVFPEDPPQDWTAWRVDGVFVARGCQVFG